MGLVLSLEEDHKIVIDTGYEKINIMAKKKKSHVKVWIDAPKDISITREKLHEEELLELNRSKDMSIS